MSDGAVEVEAEDELTPEVVRTLTPGDVIDTCGFLAGITAEPLVWEVVARETEDSVEVVGRFFGVAVLACTIRVRHNRVEFVFIREHPTPEPRSRVEVSE